jgi:hypothetical protein
VLTDYRIEQERWAGGMRERRKLAWAYGGFIANLDRWDWFVTLTLRDRTPQAEVAWERGKLRREANAAFCKPDPQLAKCESQCRHSRADGPPIPHVALGRI